jgi:tetratricopeptide (TPR) repeat protein
LGREGRWEVDRLVQRKLSRHHGDVRAAITDATGDTLQQTLLAIRDPELRASLLRRARPVTPASDSEFPEGEPESFRKRLRKHFMQRPVLVNGAAIAVLGIMAGLALAMLFFPPPREQAFPQGAQRFQVRQGPDDNQAIRLVRGLYAVLVKKADVLARLNDDPTLSDSLRKRALELASNLSPAELNRYQNSTSLNDAAWFIVRHPHNSPAAYQHALVMAEEACKISKGSGDYCLCLNTRGVAEYRVGAYEKALKTLLQSEPMNRDYLAQNQEPNESDPADVAFLAMSYYKLGKKDDARKRLEHLRKCIEVHKRGLAYRWEEAQAFLHEAEEMIEGRHSAEVQANADR